MLAKKRLSLKGALAAIWVCSSASATPLLCDDTSTKETSNPTSGWQAFTEGRFVNAITLAQAGASADDAALACRVGLIVSSFPLDDTPFTPAQTLHTALQDCEIALTRNPNHSEATVSYAIAIAAEGKRLKSVAFVKKSRRILEQALAHSVNTSTAAEGGPNPIALGALAGWHDAVSSAGLLARIATGARSTASRTLYQDAYAAMAASLSTAPSQDFSDDQEFKENTSSQGFQLSTHPHAQALIAKDMAMALEYAKFLARHKRRDQEEAAALLQLIAASPPQNAFDTQIQSRASMLASALKAGKARDINNAIEAISPFETIGNYKDTRSAYTPLCLPHIDPDERTQDCRSPQPPQP